MAEGITGQSLAGLFDLDMTSITHLARSGIVVRAGTRGRYLWCGTIFGTCGRSRPDGKAMS
jgi:hypothetical protein